MWDCPDGQDEIRCFSVKCKGLFLCPKEKLCLSFVDVCDGKIHCFDTKSDELVCESKICPRSCFCSGFLVHCIYKDIEILPPFRKMTRSLLLRNNYISSLKTLISYRFLLHLDLSFNELKTLAQHYQIFRFMTSLVFLSVAFNMINDLGKGSFRGLNELRYFYVINNPIQALSIDTFLGLPNVPQFRLSWTSISMLCNYCLHGLASVHTIEITNNKLSTIQSKAFSGMNFLKSVILKNNRIKYYDVQTFSIIFHGAMLKTDVSGLQCYFSNVADENKESKICINAKLVTFWCALISVGLLLNIPVILIRHNRLLHRNIFSVFLQNSSLSQLLLCIHYSFRVILNYGTRKVVLSENSDMMNLCKISALIFPLSQVIQVTMSFWYATCYVALVSGVNIQKAITSQAVYIILLSWISSFILSYLIISYSTILEGLCLPYSAKKASVLLLFAILAVLASLASSGLTIIGARKTTSQRIATGRHETVKEISLKIRQILDIAVDTLHYVLMGTLLSFISAKNRQSMAIVLIIDCLILLKFVTDPVIYTFAAKLNKVWNRVCQSRWKKISTKITLSSTTLTKGRQGSKFKGK